MDYSSYTSYTFFGGNLSLSNNKKLPCNKSSNFSFLSHCFWKYRKVFRLKNSSAAMQEMIQRTVLDDLVLNPPRCPLWTLFLFLDCRMEFSFFFTCSLSSTIKSVFLLNCFVTHSSRAVIMLEDSEGLSLNQERTSISQFSFISVLQSSRLDFCPSSWAQKVWTYTILAPPARKVWLGPPVSSPGPWLPTSCPGPEAETEAEVPPGVVSTPSDRLLDCVAGVGQLCCSPWREKEF